MSTLDVRLYVVTDPALTPEDRLVEMCVAAVEGGATVVQLRNKQAGDDELLRQALRLRTALREYGVTLVVNDRLDVARQAGAGVHVGVSDATPARARDALGAQAVVGWSVESPEHLASDQTAACSYVAASPVWSTPTKADTAHPLGPPGVAALRQATGLPLVGIGGINTPERAAEVIAAGADGVAVVSGVFGVGDPRAAAASLRAAVDETLRARAGAQTPAAG
ncbi:thiamine phosphate synthase [Phytoactinopolyspora alkaliphila]|uniref:Thiamine-phosphate synthase n=1 Tax=Phytoactinopolyspora alkaliphila TaxID=1783498 RepID=A0A6N9YSQ2_9ACTN|nr:thiamine phosphate synthase [Phytoactinopolyspora alkaliphila]NED97967.1 thiamine phosphate synthase [Phytoactinopolyspora alkaliphila]